jgi:hypothetical protein
LSLGHELVIECNGRSHSQISMRAQHYHHLMPISMLRFESTTGRPESGGGYLRMPWSRFGGEGVSQSPLKHKAFSTLLGQNLPFELRRKMGFRLQQIACRAPHRYRCRRPRSASVIVVHAALANIRRMPEGARLQDIWHRGRRVNSFSWVALTSRSPEIGGLFSYRRAA